ncbi:LysR family transcriptional regulator [Microvirga arabica]|uniref:LysR family transcriptional regulator n=1 Tax=Microvirga arabica TaxID=1128671 RepID=UPI001939AF9B|nr:LysR family transcriptional regulator [Microvirga arabica]MBM1173578.1 LysR family transcriptional regulator [Microvirga arabica]
MSIRDLKTFLAIAEGGSFAAAAKAVHRTQSAVTVQMQSLEEELGFALFDRSKRPPVLSEAGRALVPRIAEVVQVYDQLFRDAARSLVEGHLRLGVVPSVITGVMPRALVALRAKYPGLHVELTMGLSKDLLERVQRGTLDAAILSDLLEGGAGLLWSPFAREPLVLIAPLDAPGRKAEELLSTYPFIRYTRQAWVGQIIDRFLKQRRLRVEEAMTLDTLEAITNMVHHGLGVSIIPLRTTGDPFALPVRSITFSGAPTYRVIGLVHAPDHPKASLAEALLSELKDQVQQANSPAYGRGKPSGAASPRP